MADMEAIWGFHPINKANVQRQRPPKLSPGPACVYPNGSCVQVVLADVVRIVNRTNLWNRCFLFAICNAHFVERIERFYDLF